MTTALAAAINLVTSIVQVEKPWWPPLVATLTVLLVVAAIIVEWYERRSQTGRADELERVADWLAGKVRNQWEHEAVLRRLHDPMPLQVHWRSTRRPVAADRAVVLDDQAGADWEMLPLRGHAEEIVRAFLDLPHGRLVVLGEPGAGKSVLAILLTLGLLQHRQTLPPEERDRAPVPVLVPIASWNPEAEHLKAFLARRLGEEYPRLHQIGEDGISPAATLIADRLVLPILDGLDELPASQHASAVGELNDYAGAGPGLVVTCRSREYEQAITTLGAELARAAVVELQAVTAEQVIAFLSHPAVARPRWQPVFDHLRASPDGVLAKVLSTPLMASLARAAYTSLLTDPGELLRMTRAFDIRARLIDGFVTDAYLSDRPAPPGVRALRRYPSARAGRWLSCLAFQLAEAGRVDWWWWQLPAGLLVVRRRREKVMIAVGAVTAAAGLALTAGPLIAAAVTGLVAVNALRLWQPLWPEGYPPFFRSIARRRLVLLRMAFAATGPVLTGLVLSAPLFGSTLGLISAVAAAMLPIRQSGHTVRGSWLAGAWIGRWRMGRMRPMSRRTGPDATLRANHRAAADTAVWHAALGASIVGLAAAVVPGSPDVAAAALAGGLVYGGNAGLAAGWWTWIRYRLIHLSLATGDLLPWRLWRFLHDAHLRGVLRQAGTSWQFRHVLLQTRLASPTRTDHLRARADAGDAWAARRLVDLLAQQGQMEELRARADAGDESAAERLADLHAQQLEGE
ncbi:hypothetical protein ABT352_38695 [Streptosporangium sp. NPDC000563]|uniref:hypothetical protein n=1 Tax=Streptosporangium sp. NPDC000563 TaxID=3154366 RepID=UPI00331FD08C